MRKELNDLINTGLINEDRMINDIAKIIYDHKKAEKAIDNQDELVKRYFVTDELPLEITLKLVPNQISVTYGLESAFTATNNIVASYKFPLCVKGII